MVRGTYHCSFGRHLPEVVVAAGQEVHVECPDCDGEFGDGSRLAESAPNSKGDVPPFPGNPLAGPYVLPEAVPGDTLAVQITDVMLDRDHGITLLAPDHGFLTASQASGDQENAPPRHLYSWRLDRQAHQARLANPLSPFPLTVPLTPFVGCIGTSPREGRHVSSLYSGTFGGNLDLPSIGSGAVVLLPVFVPGGHLFLGDVHAAQGHGEVVGGGIETSANVRFTMMCLSQSRFKSFEFPRVLTADRAMAVAVSGELRIAMQEAFAAMLSWLAAATQLDRNDLIVFLSQAVTFEIGNTSSVATVVSACVDRRLFPASTFSLT